jgi:hypothetical protein
VRTVERRKRKVGQRAGMEMEDVPRSFLGYNYNHHSIHPIVIPVI